MRVKTVRFFFLTKICGTELILGWKKGFNIVFIILRRKIFFCAKEMRNLIDLGYKKIFMKIALFICNLVCKTP